MMSSADSRRLGFLVAAVLCTALAACGDGRETADQGDTQTAAGDVAMSGDSAAGGAAATMDVPTTDAGAVDLLTMIDRAEVEAGNLARQKARDPQVKAFAREMIQAHRQDMQEVQQLARRAGVTTGNTGGTTATDTAVRTDTAMRSTATDTGTRGRADTSATAGGAMAGGAMGGGTGAAAALQASHQQTMNRLRNLEGADFDSAYMSDMVTGHQQALDVLQRVENNVQNAQLEQHFSEVVSTVRQHLDRAREVQQGLSTPTGDTARRATPDTGRAKTDTSRR